MIHWNTWLVFLAAASCASSNRVKRYNKGTPYGQNGQYEGEGAGVRGQAGIDYPNYSEIPQTSFNCMEQAYPGLYADLETQCQVYHICHNGRKESFLCGMGTVFNQQIMTCDYWYSADCNSSPNFYYLNAAIGETQSQNLGPGDMQGGGGPRPQQPYGPPQQGEGQPPRPYGGGPPPGAQIQPMRGGGPPPGAQIQPMRGGGPPPGAQIQPMRGGGPPPGAQIQPHKPGPKGGMTMPQQGGRPGPQSGYQPGPQGPSPQPMGRPGPQQGYQPGPQPGPQTGPQPGHQHMGRPGPQPGPQTGHQHMARPGPQPMGRPGPQGPSPQPMGRPGPQPGYQPGPQSGYHPGPKGPAPQPMGRPGPQPGPQRPGPQGPAPQPMGRPGPPPGYQPGPQTRPPPGYQPRPQPGNQPGPQPGPPPGYQPGPQPGPLPGPPPGYQPGPQPGPPPGYQPGPQPGPPPGYQPGPQPGYQPGPQGPAPQPMGRPGPQPGPQRPGPQGPAPQPMGRPGPQPGYQPGPQPGPQRPAPQPMGQPGPQPGPQGGQQQGEYQGGYDKGGGSGGEPAGVRGTAGVDYPNYREIPNTSFKCLDQESPGYYADVDTQCQLYHVCHDGRKESILCGIGTVFNQQILACDFWYSVDCEASPSFYHLNAAILEAGQQYGSHTFKGTPYQSPQGDGMQGQGSAPDGTWVKLNNLNEQTNLQDNQDAFILVLSAPTKCTPRIATNCPFNIQDSQEGVQSNLQKGDNGFFQGGANFDGNYAAEGSEPEVAQQQESVVPISRGTPWNFPSGTMMDSKK